VLDGPDLIQISGAYLFMIDVQTIAGAILGGSAYVPLPQCG
jgi:hypothetical protein